MVPNTTSDDAADAAIIVDQSYDADWRLENGRCIDRTVDNFLGVIVDVQLYRLSRLAARRHSQLSLVWQFPSRIPASSLFEFSAPFHSNFPVFSFRIEKEISFPFFFFFYVRDRASSSQA